MILKAALADITLSTFLPLKRAVKMGQERGKEYKTGIEPWSKSKFYDQKLRTFTVLPYDTEQW